MQQKVILHSEQVSRKGEIKYFQIPLQGVALKIIAVEVSAFLFSNMPDISTTPKPTPAPAPIPTPTPAPAPVSNNCPNPGSATIDPVSSNTAGGIITQVFRIGAVVNPTFVYSCGVYSVTVSVTALDGDTPASIAAKLATEVNNTSLAAWSQYGSNNHNYKPTASNNGDLLTLTVDSQHSFFASGQGSCTGAPPPPPPPPPPPMPQLLDYDPLFTIVSNERAGVLSLQSPDATDIFFQCDAWRQDKNINFGDFSFPGEVQDEWLKGRKRNATEVDITTASPILEAYYKDSWGVYYNQDVSYGLNILVWFENMEAA
ncbi:hypothetical protein [Flavisolibacter nicotianae]|uniref:hypothetical protein n=1 Tax=Flavisolibacter nicotianae TaxID=2364882 RepID=UPI000EAD1FCB|nr:hypothetical protein [Flavisolibacter nicotianae]